MKYKAWITLTIFNLICVLFLLLPFMPGPSTNISYALSMPAGAVAIFGFVWIPIGILWLIYEIKRYKSSGQRVNNRRDPSWYFALVATVVSIAIYLVFTMVNFQMDGPQTGIIMLAVLLLLIYMFIPKIKKLKHREGKSFNPAPIYLLSLPLIVWATHLYLSGPASDYSRKLAINQSQVIIEAIEKYNSTEGEYPETLEDLSDRYLAKLPSPAVMGINGFKYERNADAYNLSFVQWQHFRVTEERVMFNKNDQHNVKGHFASFAANQPHWRYYWLD